MTSKIYSYGHYEVAGKQYYNKLSAYEAAFSIGHTPHWNFYDEEFSQHDWTVEPQQSILELYGQRARHIRDNTDYVILWFSGGMDSWNIADSFVRNGLLIDEMWSVSPVNWTEAGDVSRVATNHANETRLTTIPEAKKILERDPRIKYRVIDSSEEIIDFWSNNRVDPFEYNHFVPEFPVREFSNRFYTASVPGGSSIVKLVGIDKPRVVYINGQFHMVFLDQIAWSRIATNRTIHTDTSDYDMAFYWHPAATTMLIKQGHLIKNWFKSNPEFMYLLSLSPSSEMLELYQKIIGKIIYPTYNHSLWQADKFTGLWDIETYHKFSSNTTSHATQNWRNTILTYSDAVYDMYRTYNRLEDSVVPLKKYNWYYTLPGCYSKFYSLGA